MAYIKTTWENLPSENTPINASNLNKIEEGIYQNSIDIEEKIVDNYSTETDKGYSANYLNNNQTNAKILWTNSNPTSNFTSGNITLSSSNYDILEFVFRYSVNSDTRYFFVKTIKGHGSEVMCLINYNEGVSQATELPWRKVDYVNDTTYSISECLSRSTDTNTTPYTANNRLIPLYVIGYKTGLFN